MKRILHILSLGTLLSLAACEGSFEIEQGGEYKIYVQAIANSSFVYITPRLAAPVGSAPKETEFTVEAQVNGEPLRIQKIEREEGGPCYLAMPSSVLDAFEEGDEIKIKVSCPDAKEASGSTTVYSGNPIIGAEIENYLMFKDDRTERYGKKVKLILDREPEAGEHYALKIMIVSELYCSDGRTTTQIYHRAPGYLTSQMELTRFDFEDYMRFNFDETYLGGSGEYQPLTLLPDHRFEGHTYTFYLGGWDEDFIRDIVNNTPQGDGSIAGGDTPSGSIVAARPGSYYFTLYRISDEFYYFAKALYQSNFDFLSNMGLTPANFTYSNVDGGLGFVGFCAPSAFYVEGEYESINEGQAPR
ncbi:MAG: DUF4249 family protein [Bacteroidales bacterium]|nr:DUF4249 family protein [Bacteroidales bacterium]MBR1782763.1 DUF4249 family protein [Bacteroidales bacterium]